MSKGSNKHKVLCEFCGKEIPEERLEILPDTTTCVECSQTQPYSSDDLLSRNVSGENQPDGLNMEDFEEYEGPEISVNSMDY